MSPTTDGGPTTEGCQRSLNKRAIAGAQTLADRVSPCPCCADGLATIQNTTDVPANLDTLEQLGLLCYYRSNQPHSPALLLWVIGLNFHLNTHVVLAQACHSDARPERLVVGHPFGKVARHCLNRLTVQRNVVRSDLVDLTPVSSSPLVGTHLVPPFSAGGTQREVNILESLVDLRVDLAVDDKGLGVPATYSTSQKGMSLDRI